MKKVMNKNNKKGAIVQSNILYILIGTITLLIIIGVFFIPFSSFNEKASAIYECKTLFELIDVNYVGKFSNEIENTLKSPADILPDSFKNKLGVTEATQFDALLLDIMKNKCKSYDVEVEENYVEPAINLVNECWNKVSQGKDILSYGEKEGIGMCLHCGNIKSTYFQNFNKEFYEELKENNNAQKLRIRNTEIENLNSELLFDVNSIPNEITNDNPLGVFYFIYKPKSEENKPNFGGIFIDNSIVSVDKYLEEGKTFTKKTSLGEFSCDYFIIPKNIDN